MKNEKLEAVVAIVIALGLAGALAAAGSVGSAGRASLPLFALCGLVAFAINWVAFLPAYLFKTEHHYDLIGSCTYLTLVALAFAQGGAGDPRALLLAVLICAWAVRLGSFLFLRVKRVGKDARFDRVKVDFLRFLMAWTLQALWVYVTLGCALAAITSVEKTPLGWPAWLGTVIWGVGFGIEAVADRQKREFRSDEANHGRFIATGLWAWSRHPNYFGEIMLWVGIAVICSPGLSGWQLATLISPLFVYLLLTRVSGIPLLDARALEKWGDDPDYQAYRARTPPLFLRRPAKAPPPEHLRD